MAGAEMGDWETVGGLELDRCIRHEVFRGCELSKQLETKLNSAEGSDLHQLVAQFSTQIVDTFGKALDLLNSDGNPNSARWREDLSNLPEKQIAGGVPGRGRPKGTPVKDIKNNSPCSGGRSSVSGSPPSDMSEGSPACNMVISPKLKRAEPAESSENEPGSFKERRDISRKRKLLPKRIERRPANTSEQGNDIPPDDGFTWRKYGQKDILGARYPRSYYRCTHKNDMGCQATKQVQRPDDDSSFYDITYRGRHTCRVDRPLLQIELPFSIAQIGSNADSNSSLPNTLIFGTGYSLESNTSTGHGLLPTQFNSSSREASGPCFGMNSVGCKNENLDDFRQSPVSPLLSSWTTLPQDHPNEGMQSIRPGKTCVSSFRRPSNEGENFIDFIPSHPNECAAFSEGELGMGNFDQIFGSPATTQSSYIPLAPTMPLINPMESVPGQLVQTSESDLTEVVSGHTSAANSPMLDMDLMFNTNCSELHL